MRNRIMIAVLLPLTLTAACAGRAKTPAMAPPRDGAAVSFVESGFLTSDYSLLVQVKPGSVRRAYENPAASFSSYDNIFIDRVTIWRDDDQTEPVESADFQRVVDAIYALASRELGKAFKLVDKPGPGVGRMRVALVAVDEPDDRLDVYVSQGGALLAESDQPLPAGMREFGRNAWVEAEILDGVTNEPIFAVVDRAADVIPHAEPIKTWHDLQQALAAWAAQASQRLRDLKGKH